MLQFTRWKTIATLLICLFGVLLCIPNFLTKERFDALPALAKHKFGLGLDLRGGAHLLTTMDLDELRKDWLTNVQDDVRKRLREAKIVFTPPGIQAGAVNVHHRPGRLSQQAGERPVCAEGPVRVEGETIV